jgi:hypothetical protein
MTSSHARTTRTIVVKPPAQGFRCADLVFEGVEQAGRSFEARVFLNKPDADERTARTLGAGYAGAFHVYGYGPQQPRGPGVRSSAQSAPITKYLVATEAVRQALRKTARLSVTVVAVPPVAGPHFHQVMLVFDRLS